MRRYNIEARQGRELVVLVIEAWSNETITASFQDPRVRVGEIEDREKRIRLDEIEGEGEGEE